MQGLNQHVQAILDELVQDGREIGVQAAAYYRGELVLEACAGFMDPQTQRPVRPDTLFGVMSASKAIVATCIHVLVDRGLLDLDAPVCAYWPDFAALGKRAVTIRDVLTHSAGVPTNPAGYCHDWARNWDAMCARIADLAPEWPAGTRTGYHSLNYGWILGEVIRRVDGRLLDRFVQEELCEPLGMESLYMGVPECESYRTATLVVPSEEDATSPMKALVESFNRQEIRRCVIPAVGVWANARSMAQHYAMLAADGALDCVRVLSPEAIERAARLQTDDVDAVYRMPIRKALGYWMGGPAMKPLVGRAQAFGHPGIGGSIGFADPERGLGFAYVKNAIRLQTDLTLAREVIDAVYEALPE
jgi:CubicO group peptidase (beta-lactamase class C family)